MTRAEVRARFRRIAARALAAPHPIALALPERGLGPKPTPYLWGATKVNGRQKSKGTKEIGHETIEEDVDGSTT